MAPLIRNLISRATALVVGVALAYVCWWAIGGVRQIIAEHPERATMSRQERERNSDGLGVPLIIAFISGIGAFATFGYAVVPTRALYALPIAPPRDPRDDAEAIVSWGRRW